MKRTRLIKDDGRYVIFYSTRHTSGERDEASGSTRIQDPESGSPEPDGGGEGRNASAAEGRD